VCAQIFIAPASCCRPPPVRRAKVRPHVDEAERQEGSGAKRGVVNGSPPPSSQPAARRHAADRPPRTQEGALLIPRSSAVRAMKRRSVVRLRCCASACVCWQAMLAAKARARRRAKATPVQNSFVREEGNPRVCRVAVVVVPCRGRCRRSARLVSLRRVASGYQHGRDRGDARASR